MINLSVGGKFRELLGLKVNFLLMAHTRDATFNAKTKIKKKKPQHLLANTDHKVNSKINNGRTRGTREG